MNRHVVAGLIGLALVGCAQDRSATNPPAGPGQGVGPVGLSPIPSIHEAIVKDNANVDPATLPSNVVGRANQPYPGVPAIPVPTQTAEAQPTQPAPASPMPAEAAATAEPQPAPTAQPEAEIASSVKDEPIPSVPAATEEPAAPAAASEANSAEAGATPEAVLPATESPTPAAPAAEEVAPAMPAEPAATAPAEAPAAEATPIAPTPDLNAPGADLAVPKDVMEATPSSESTAPALPQETPTATEAPAASPSPAPAPAEVPAASPAPAPAETTPPAIEAPPASAAAPASGDSSAIELPPTSPDVVPAQVDKPLAPSGAESSALVPGEPGPIELPPTGPETAGPDATIPGASDPLAIPASNPQPMPTEAPASPIPAPAVAAPAPAASDEPTLPDLPPLSAPGSDSKEMVPPPVVNPSASAPKSSVRPPIVPASIRPSTPKPTTRPVTLPKTSVGTKSAAVNVGAPIGAPNSSAAPIDTNVQTTSNSATMLQSRLGASDLLEAGKVAARVGDEVITLHELTLGVKQKLRRYPGQQPSREQLNMVAAAVMAEMIEESMLFQEAKRELKNPKQMQMLMGFAEKYWNEEEVEPMIKKTASANVYELKKKLEEKGESLDRMHDNYLRGFVAKSFIQNKLSNKLSVSLPEMREYYNEHLKDFDQPAMVSWREIVVDFRKSGGPVESRKKALSLMARLSKGEPFAKVAQAESQGPNSKEGGLWETSPGSYAIAPVNEALEKLRPGQISQIIETPESLHIVVVESRRAAGPASFADAEIQRKIRNSIHSNKLQKATTGFIDKIREQTPVVTMFDNTASDPRIVIQRMQKR
ncbi:peptidyl-prolyl cis-trans isomerase [Singulisphaera sp. PoT]|uniref:peptidylprolyl isomerase n=1 Tax=Singulisphaera sp. PoT TaxID=3411797 RepID=UPI003BF60750